MSNVLVRGLPENVHRQIEKMAEEESTSVNQLLVRLLTEAVKHAREKKDAEERRMEVFRRIDEMRERLYQKYGLFDDSTKLIREDRDSR